MSADAHQVDSAEQSREGAGGIGRIDTSRAHPARVYDFFLGGKDNFPADREAAKAALAAEPRGFLNVRHNRDFLRRAVTYLTAQAGIRQFLDVGTGLPTQENVHQIAQRIAPESRVVYVDNDPVVLAHARALLATGPEGRTDYMEYDLRDWEAILAEAARTIDFDRPVALVLAAVLHFVPGEEAHAVTAGLLDALPSGSALVLSHLTDDLNPVQVGNVAKAFKERGFSMVRRPRAEIGRFVADNGLELAEPGIVPVHRWRPTDLVDRAKVLEADQAYVDGLEDVDRTKYQGIDDVTDADINLYALVAHKP
ncbi:SAM-dependent methyltransferase [Streptomyces sp. NPDC048057]|uniref:SAM-dependent methyltransferase n=1 Tax=Streptomyces sp. NPDC048057 TaxID=3155628 RepID=UPI0033C07904